jgi:hypothetical protein
MREYSRRVFPRGFLRIQILYHTLSRKPERTGSSRIQTHKISTFQDPLLSGAVRQAQADLWLQGVERLTTEGSGFGILSISFNIFQWENHHF